MSKTKECKCGTIYEQYTPLQNKCTKCLIAKQKKIEVALWNTEKGKIKENLKTLSEWKDDLQVEINFIVRLIDSGQPCIATEATIGKRNAGHYISRGSNDTIRFHLHNIHIQSEHSNKHLHGDTLRYRAGIKKVYGEEYMDYMDSLQSIKPINLSIAEIKEFLPKAKMFKNWLIKEDKIYTAEERLKLRTSINKSIGIYKTTNL